MNAGDASQREGDRCEPLKPEPDVYRFDSCRLESPARYGADR